MAAVQYMLVRVNTANAGSYGNLLPSQTALIAALGAIPTAGIIAQAAGPASPAQAAATILVSQDAQLLNAINAATVAAATTQLNIVAAVVDARGNVTVGAR